MKYCMQVFFLVIVMGKIVEFKIKTSNVCVQLVSLEIHLKVLMDIISLERCRH